jgi:uncharacterized membrane protein YtjA (UPF0391 family)
MKRCLGAALAWGPDGPGSRGDEAMLRWYGVLLFLVVLTGLLNFGVIPTHATGLARLLMFSFAGLLAFSLIIGLLRRP